MSTPTPSLPSFRTARLQFEPLCDSDDHAEGMYALRAIPEVMKWSLRKVPDADIAATRTWMTAFTGVHAPPRVGYVVRLLPTDKEMEEGDGDEAKGRIIASIGLRYEEVMLVPGGHAWELGYIFQPDVWGKGYATEAVQGLLRVWKEIYESLQWEGKETGEVGPGVAAVTNKKNEGSMNVLRKCGFRKLGEKVDELGTSCVIFGLDVEV